MLRFEDIKNYNLIARCRFLFYIEHEDNNGMQIMKNYYIEKIKSYQIATILKYLII